MLPRTVAAPLLAACAAVAMLAVTGCGSTPARSTATVSPSDPAAATALHGVVPTGTQSRPSFTLTDTSGRRYDFGARTAGRVTLLYFGYTHCPDECPTAMADLASALRRQPAGVARQVTVVFVTTDPWRDSRHRLRSWLDRFDRQFVGLTGTPAQVARAERATHLPLSSKESAPKSYGSGKYAVNHFAAVVVYGRDDRLATLYPSGVAPADIAADLRVLAGSG